tara:strand:+ start:213 stop:425 length:213 start_codon:yes stop_codon:yes gene_type:complete
MGTGAKRFGKGGAGSNRRYNASRLESVRQGTNLAINVGMFGTVAHQRVYADCMLMPICKFLHAAYSQVSS